MNILFATLLFGLSLLTSGLLSAVFLLGAAWGVLIGLVNIIPLKISGIPNDGYNVFRQSSPAARRALGVVLRANAAMANGMRPRDFPVAWFDWVEPEDVDGPMLGSVAILRYHYLLDRQDFAEAEALIKTLLDTDKLVELHGNELRCERLFLELVGACRAEEVERLYTKKLQDYIKATSIYVSRQRLLYAYARLFTKVPATAAKHLALFEKACTTSGSLGEIPGERELITYVDAIADQRLEAAQ